MDESPFDNRDGLIWLDGHFVPWRDAQEHILNQGLHYGSSVFEGERAYDGNIFRSFDHSRRLIHSANRLEMDIDFTIDQIEDAKREALARSGLESAYLRPVIWRGANQMGISVGRANVRVAVAVWHWADYFANKAEGIRITYSPWARPPANSAPVDAKAAGLYMICTLAKRRAERSGFADALMLDSDGNIAETTGANIFFFRDGGWHTPAPTCFLNGITRQTIIALLRSNGAEVTERVIAPDELKTFSQCFITGSATEVTPVRELMGILYTVGPETLDVMAYYDAAVHDTSAKFEVATIKLEGQP